MKRLKLTLLYGLAISMMFTSCEKENQDNQPKLKSLTITDSISYQERIEFSYDNDGRLQTVRQLSNDGITNSFNYQYENGMLNNISHYNGVSAGGGLVSKIKFSYSNKKLQEIIEEPQLNPKGLQITKYKFEHDGDRYKGLSGSLGSYPIGDNFNPDYPYFSQITMVTALLDRWKPGQAQFDPNTVPKVQLVTFSYKYDSHNNPLYQLPLIRAVKAPGLISNGAQYTYFFDAHAYFNTNNKSIFKSTQTTTDVLASYDYTYGESGLPIKCKITSTSIQGFTTTMTTLYEYYN